jgi:radical SAM protein with 4Fe4S-binding SPASM domain
MAIKDSFDFFIQWHFTEKCNLRCKHCYQSGKKKIEMSLPEIRESIVKISDTLSAWRGTYNIDFSPSVNISGGEPFLRGDIFEIISDFRRHEFEIYLLTNGTLIDKEKAEDLYESGVKGVQVSIEGPEAVHNAIRGRKSFSNSLSGVKNLLNAGLEVTLNVTLSKLNADYFAEMIKLSSDLGVHYLGFSRLVPSGRGASLVKEMLRKETVRNLYTKIFNRKMNGITIVTGDPVASQLMRKQKGHGSGTTPLGGCAAGISGLTILSDGTLVPCRRLPVPIGNIKKDSLREVWAMSEVLNALRDKSRYKGKCSSCKKWARCRGCRAIAYAYSASRGQADILAQDPQCFLN